MNDEPMITDDRGGPVRDVVWPDGITTTGRVDVELGPVRPRTTAGDLAQQMAETLARLGPLGNHIRIELPFPDRMVLPQATYDELRRVFEAIIAAAEQLAAAALPQLRQLADDCRAHGLVPETPPDDPMQRALWLRKHRNTGPRPRRRAPRSLPAGGRR
jgi:hypothetical protein